MKADRRKRVRAWEMIFDLIPCRRNQATGIDYTTCGRDKGENL